MAESEVGPLAALGDTLELAEGVGVGPLPVVLLIVTTGIEDFEQTASKAVRKHIRKTSPNHGLRLTGYNLLCG